MPHKSVISIQLIHCAFFNEYRWNENWSLVGEMKVSKVRLSWFFHVCVYVRGVAQAYYNHAQGIKKYLASSFPGIHTSSINMSWSKVGRGMKTTLHSICTGSWILVVSSSCRNSWVVPIYLVWKLLIPQHKCMEQQNLVCSIARTTSYYYYKSLWLPFMRSCKTVKWGTTSSSWTWVWREQWASRGPSSTANVWFISNLFLPTTAGNTP